MLTMFFRGNMGNEEEKTFKNRTKSGVQHGLEFFAAEDIYNTSKEYSWVIFAFLLVFVGPIAITLYFFRKINHFVYSILQGETRNTEKRVSIIKRFLLIVILPFMVITLLFVTPPLLRVIDSLIAIITNLKGGVTSFSMANMTKALRNKHCLCRQFKLSN